MVDLSKQAIFTKTARGYYDKRKQLPKDKGLNKKVLVTGGNGKEQMFVKSY